MIGKDGNRRVRAVVELAWLWLPIAIRASRLSSREAASYNIHASSGDIGGNPYVDYSSSVSHQYWRLAPC